MNYILSTQKNAAPNPGRFTTAFNKMLSISGASVSSVEFTPQGVVVGLRRRGYTTNSIESLNYGIRKIIKNRGHFPNDAAVVRLIWLAIRDIKDKAVRRRAKERGKPEPEPRADGKLRATTVQG